MAELTTLARPYAKAAFKLAQQTDSLSSWSSMLTLLAQVVTQSQVSEMIVSPQRSAAQKAQVLISILGDELNPSAQLLVQVLADNKRLLLLPQIVLLYSAMKAALEQTVEVSIVSAFALTAQQQTQLTQLLTQRLGRQVSLVCSVEPALIGGVVIRAGDSVIDASIQGKLTKLSEAIQS